RVHRIQETHRGTREADRTSRDGSTCFTCPQWYPSAWARTRSGASNESRGEGKGPSWLALPGQDVHARRELRPGNSSEHGERHEQEVQRGDRSGAQDTVRSGRPPGKP